MHTKTLPILGIIFTLGFLSACKDDGVIANPGKFGQFIGKVKVSWVENGIDMKLEEKFSYISPKTNEAELTRWEVPPGTITNGASIPAWLWTPLGSPFVGKYRRAAVIHDYFTETKSRPSKQVHRMFYNASQAGGSSERTAKYMYGALLAFGESWKVTSAITNNANTLTPTLASTSSATRSVAPAAPLPANSVVPPDLPRPMKIEDARQKYLQDMLKWITEKQPTPEQIEIYVQKHKQPGR